MIGRFWKGWTSAENADAYENLLRTKVFPHIRDLEGHKGAYLFRRDVEDGVEFATLTLFESLDAVKRFAGENYEIAVVPPEARKLLSRFDVKSVHYETRIQPE